MLVALLSVSLLIGPGAGPAYAAQTPLADIPIASKVTAKPNIVYTLDDSGSMQFNYLPDWVIAAQPAVSISKITRVGAIATVQVASTAALSAGQFVTIIGANQPEYNGEFQITITDATHFHDQVAGAPITPATVARSPIRSAPAYCRSGNNATACTANNANYITTFTVAAVLRVGLQPPDVQPQRQLQPPVKDDGTPLTHTIGTDTDVNWATRHFRQRPDGPVRRPCDARRPDRPSPFRSIATPTGRSLAGANLASIADVGDANGEYKAGTGDWCRINGTKYDASVASGAPAVVEDYNYPYKSFERRDRYAVFLQAGGQQDPLLRPDVPLLPAQRRGRHQGLHRRHADYRPGTTTKQTCNLGTPGKTCNPTVALRNFTPSACKTPSALYCLPGVGGSDGNSPGTGTAPECLSCTCNADYQPANAEKCSSPGAACTSVCGAPGCDRPNVPNRQRRPHHGLRRGAFQYANSTAYAPAARDCGVVSCSTRRRTAVSTTTTLQDSNAQGYACRHNNQVYAVSGAPAAGTPFTYPRTNLSDVYAANKTGVRLVSRKGNFTTAVTCGCPTIGTTIAIPRHYYEIDSVQFCNNIDATVNGQWSGFGTGVCQAELTT